MDLYLLAIAAACLFRIRVHVKGFHAGYLGRESTSCIKGIFVLIVFYSHLVTYTQVLPHDMLIYQVRSYLGQLMVVPFLFISGYGIFEQNKRDGDYYKRIPQKRVLMTLFHFITVVIIYGLIQLLLGKRYALSAWLLSFVGWSSLGNSNWYIFAILCLYALVYLCFAVFQTGKSRCLSVLLFSGLLALCLAKVRPSYFYNTMMAFPAGMVWSYYKGHIDEVCSDGKRHLALLVLAIGVLLGLSAYRSDGDWYYQLLSVAFAAAIVLISMKIELRSPILKWVGDRLFWVYILQRIPMLVLKRIGYDSHPYRFALVAFAVTIALSAVFDYAFKAIDPAVLRLLTSHKTKGGERSAKQS